jgi:transcription antitermination factor NusG
MIWFPIRTSAGAFRNMHSSPRTRLEHALKDYDYYIAWEWYEFKHHRSKKIIQSRKPLIPGYCFIANVTDWPALDRIPEISGPIRGMDNRPRTIRATEIDRLREAEAMVLAAFENRNVSQKAWRERKWPTGSTVKIGTGHVMSGREARVLEATGRKTIKAVIDGLFGGAGIEIEIPVELVEDAA